MTPEHYDEFLSAVHRAREASDTILTTVTVGSQRAALARVRQVEAQLSEAQARHAESELYWRERAELAEASVALWRDRADAHDWRIAASAWLTHKADKQAAMNKAHPRYVECYPEWEQAERALRWYASEVLTTLLGGHQRATSCGEEEHRFPI